MTLSFHRRDEWSDDPRPLSGSRRGVKYAVVHHTAGPAFLGDATAKALFLRNLEHYVTGQNAPGNTSPLAAIDYNILVFPDGEVWEGRGYGNEDAATLQFNEQSVSVCAVGNYDVSQPTDALLVGIAGAINLGILGGWVAADPIVWGHRDVGTFPTACPGKYLESRLAEVKQFMASNTQPEPKKEKPKLMTEFYFRDANGTIGPKGAIYLVQGAARMHVNADQRALYDLAAGIRENPIPDLKDLNPTQLDAMKRVPLVGAA